MMFAEVALAAYVGHKFDTSKIEPGLKETAFYDPTNFTFPAGCHICEVEIDKDTGATRIVNFTAIDDFGTVINPMIVEGQCMAASRRASARRCWSTASTTARRGS